MLTFNLFHPVPVQTEVNCCKEPAVPDPFSKTLILLMKHALAYKFSFVFQVKSIKLCKTKVAMQRFCLQLQERTKDVQQNKDNEERQKKKY